jgi:hypothetical protein
MFAMAKESMNGTHKIQQKLQTSLTESVFNTLLATSVPVSVADKLSRQISENIDLLSLYKTVEKDIQALHFPKQRILDRTIVHMFEILFQIINPEEQYKGKEKQKEFFTIVPRGECLDLFLQLVKEYCMGDAEIKRHTYKIEPIIEKYRCEDRIDWETLYKSKEFKTYLKGLLNLILTHLREDQKPIPALENKIPIRYQPYRINSFLNQICQLKQNGLLDLD